MGYYDPVSTTTSNYESGDGPSRAGLSAFMLRRPSARAVRYARRLILMLLFVGANYLLLSMIWNFAGFHQVKETPKPPVPIRGNVGMRPLGEVCLVDQVRGLEHKIENRYAIVFDAGSTGSRVHVYEFQFCGDHLRLLVDEVFEEVKPGLSHFHASPRDAAHSLSPLLKSAMERIPPDLHQCTPMVMKATAGLRLLPEESVDGILKNVRTYLAAHPFHHHPEEGVTVMDGAEEAVFGWVTVNYLQGKLGHGYNPADYSAVLEMGGGSTQIVFAIDKIQVKEEAQLKDSYYHLHFQGKDIYLYQHSHLGFGLMEARKVIKRAFLDRMAPNSDSNLWFSCFPKDHQETLTKGDANITLIGTTPSWDACLSQVMPIFKKQAQCIHPPCSFNGVHQPPLKSKNVVAFSFFYDRLTPLGLTSPLTPFEIAKEGIKLCSASPQGHYLRLLEENPNYCLDVAYIFTLLHIGYQFDMDQPIEVTKQINGYEACWSLGAALKLLETPMQGKTCPVNK